MKLLLLSIALNANVAHTCVSLSRPQIIITDYSSALDSNVKKHWPDAVHAHHVAMFLSTLRIGSDWQVTPDGLPGAPKTRGQVPAYDGHDYNTVGQIYTTAAPTVTVKRTQGKARLAFAPLKASVRLPDIKKHKVLKTRDMKLTVVGVMSLTRRPDLQLSLASDGAHALVAAQPAGAATATPATLIAKVTSLSLNATGYVSAFFCLGAKPSASIADCVSAAGGGDELALLGPYNDTLSAPGTTVTVVNLLPGGSLDIFN